VAVTSSKPIPDGGAKWKIAVGWVLVVGVTVFSVLFWPEEDLTPAKGASINRTG